ncbi:MAG: hypothetical protein HUK02_05950 [Bacteroidaceae bacterium]|nr:hypothetical protein [Bacteroidaceae bacterium]
MLAFPDSAEGHIRKAEILANAQRYSEADAVYDNYLKRHGNQCEDVLFSRARLIYACRQDASRVTQLPENWSLDQALVYVRQANAASPSVGYRMHEAEILYAQKNYADALSIYKDLATKERNANLYAYACMCLEAMDSPKEEQLAMADSAVACYQKPYPTEAAQYLYLRSTIKRSMNQMREAVKDLNEYEHLMQGRLTEQFYYERMQMELSTRMYQQAIDDINKAIQLNPREPVYRAEYAALLYRINEFESSIQQCEETLALEPNFPDAYRIWGLCLRRQGNSAAAKEKLREAQELGDELAAKLIEEIDKE